MLLYPRASDQLSFLFLYYFLFNFLFLVVTLLLKNKVVSGLISLFLSKYLKEKNIALFSFIGTSGLQCVLYSGWFLSEDHRWRFTCRNFIHQYSQNQQHKGNKKVRLGSRLNWTITKISANLNRGTGAAMTLQNCTELEWGF